MPTKARTAFKLAYKFLKKFWILTEFIHNAMQKYASKYKNSAGVRATAPLKPTLHWEQDEERNAQTRYPLQTPQQHPC